MSAVYITIVGYEDYYGERPFRVGHVVKLVKEPERGRDGEAVRVELPYIDTIGYVANSEDTVCGGTCSAGRIYERIGNAAFARVLFVTPCGIIAKLLLADKSRDAEGDEEGEESTPGESAVTHRGQRRKREAEAAAAEATTDV